MVRELRVVHGGAGRAGLVHGRTFASGVRGAVHTERVESWCTLIAAAYSREDEHFIAVIRGAGAPRTTVDEGVAALQAAVVVKRSAQRGEAVEVNEVLR